MFISMMFAGHHTSSGTAAWTMIELLRHPDVMAEVDRRARRAVRRRRRRSPSRRCASIPQLEAALKETLRLHPPLILLLRVAQQEIELGGHTIPAGHHGRRDAAGVEPDRRGLPRAGARSTRPATSTRARRTCTNRWTWIPFGAGRHRCVGNAFAMMQLKAIFSVILRDYEFEMAQPSETYRDDCSKMVIQLEQPCRVRYRADGRPMRVGRRPRTCARRTRCARSRRRRCSGSTRRPTRSSCSTEHPGRVAARPGRRRRALLPRDGAVIVEED